MAKGKQGRIGTGKRAEILPSLDPRLQRHLLTGDVDAYVDVIARLHDPGAGVEGLHVVRTIGPIVTGRVRVGDIEQVRRHPNVASLKKATGVRPALAHSVPEIEATPANLSPQALTGEGVIVGIVDQHFDFRHNNFRNADGNTRLRFLWDQRQTENPLSPPGFRYGREFAAPRINAALAAANPYQELDYEPAASSHGTHVADIACGNGRATGHAGVAPAAGIVFVHLSGGDADSLGNSRHLLEAVEYVFVKADELGLPAVVNISLSTYGGPHDGSTLVEQAFDELLKTAGRAIVVAAGNSRNKRSHASGILAPAEVKRLRWRIDPSDATPNEMEIWYDTAGVIETTVLTPSGRRIGPVPAGATVPILKGGQPAGSIVSRVADPNNGAHQIEIVLQPELPSGRWIVEMKSAAAAPFRWDAWIERDDAGQSAFAKGDVDPRMTLGSIACGRSSLSVGSYQPRASTRDISVFSAEGPTRDGRSKPELSAPGDPVSAAESQSQSEFPDSGTSMAAPHVSGVVALLFEAAPRRLTIAETRDALIASARRNPPGGTDWDSRYGFGRVSARAALARMASRLAPVAAAAPQTSAGGNVE
ncbi:MAG: S8 family peptidase [Acidobacteria bacterium]|nr:S8 family peptidase [Acidobacteriota bacterium]